MTLKILQVIGVLVFAFASLFTVPSELTAAELANPGLDPGMVNPGFQEKPAWFKNSFLDLREDVAEARAEGKHLLLYFYQDGCPYCEKLLDTNFSQREIEKLTRERYEVIAINIWGDREVVDLQGQELIEKQFASQLKVMFTPTLLFFDQSGEVVLRLNGYYPPHRFKVALEYASSPAQRETQSFRDYLKQLAPVAAQGKLHQDERYIAAPYKLDSRPAKRPLVVFFEQADCADCDELHLDILKRPESQQQLQKFDVALLDMWSNAPVTAPDGQTFTAAQWARAMNIQYAPTAVLFDVDGNEVFRTEAYLKAFHIQSALEYVASGAFKQQPSFQRYISSRADALEGQGVHVDIMQ